MSKRLHLILTCIPLAIVSVFNFFEPSERVAKAANNGLAQTPILGWSSWSTMRTAPTEDKIRDVADRMAILFKPHGYSYVNVDDFYQLDWSKQVDPYGRWLTDPAKFPHGMKALADYVHQKGLRFGLYVTPGIPKAAVDQNTPIEGTPYHARDIADTSRFEANYNFKNMYYIDYHKPGAQAYIDSWAKLFASYGVDFLKLDGVGEWDIPDIKAWAKALKHSGRKIHLELANNLSIRHAKTWRKLANGWRTNGDVETSGPTITDWDHIRVRFDAAAKWYKYADPGGWNDLDSINVANGSHDGLTNYEKRSHVSLWAIAASHFYMGSDLNKLDEYGKSLLLNDEILAVNQSGVAGQRIWNDGNAQMFLQKLPDHTYYVALFNLSTSTRRLRINLSELGCKDGATIRDLWRHSDLGTYHKRFAVEIAPHDAWVLRVSPIKR